MGVYERERELGECVWERVCQCAVSLSRACRSLNACSVQQQLQHPLLSQREQQSLAPCPATPVQQRLRGWGEEDTVTSAFAWCCTADQEAGSQSGADWPAAAPCQCRDTVAEGTITLNFVLRDVSFQGYSHPYCLGPWRRFKLGRTTLRTEKEECHLYAIDSICWGLCRRHSKRPNIKMQSSKFPCFSSQFLYYDYLCLQFVTFKNGPDPTS
ncbi:uncharacterized protein LOC128832255 isoform X1 [Malaclemys terrapin pileata]|uniref:uncharacterized protein LOC128832255 isoform X1 n=1 Tax=Malaclemys terrapin pileata TaxID=2991368 RepID=UPI0023A907BB|nr:uncharacterized protein LOC128832255 isoform X1 [Malaclemys terrapin pileata]